MDGAVAYACTVLVIQKRYVISLIDCALGTYIFCNACNCSLMIPTFSRKHPVYELLIDQSPLFIFAAHQ